MSKEVNIENSEFKVLMRKLVGLYGIDREFPSIKELLNKVRQISHADLQEWSWMDKIVTYKADGKRCLLVLENGQTQLFFENKIVYAGSNANLQDKCVFEGEAVPCTSSPAERGKTTIYLYDIHMINGKQCFNDLYSKRLSFLRSMSNLLSGLETSEFAFKQKEYTIIDKKNKLKNIPSICDAYLRDFKPNDGLIINFDSPYFQQTILKWKPIKQQTIDFYVEKRNSKYILYSLVARNILNCYQIADPSLVIEVDSFRVLIPFSPSFAQGCLSKSYEYVFDSAKRIFDTKRIQNSTSQSKSYKYVKNSTSQSKSSRSNRKQEVIKEKTVCEFRFDLKRRQWVFLRIRDDRSPQQKQFGNYMPIAEEIYMSYFNFIDKDELYSQKRSKQAYFQQVKGQQYEAMTAYQNQVKRSVIELIVQSGFRVLDLACGKGQDLFKYESKKPSQLIMVDNDIDALQQLVSRKNQRLLQKQKKGSPISHFYLNTSVLEINLEQDAKSLLDHIEENSIDCVFCNYAVHYLMPNIETLAQCIRKLLKPKSKLCFFFMDGSRVFDALRNKKQLVLKENGSIKYMFKRHFTSAVLKRGLEIELKLPFSKDLYKEELVDAKFLKDLLQTNGFSLADEFLLSFDDIKEKNDQTKQLMLQFAQLAEIDQFYVSLYKCLIFEKQ